MAGRIETLQGLIAQDPGNSRLRYMLAMEIANAGDLEGAVKIYQEIIERDADYSAAYFHGGQTLERLGRIEDAKTLYRQGIEATTRNGDSHTRSELEGALAQIGG
ncbi:MAG: tetratricopeptide repeat protein [Bryobacterales bacterium]|nr:tetratricopeptide repeat protein [Bryobacterales bacterium]